MKLKSALILKPRLDIPFKDNGQPVPKEVGPPNHPVRYHWVEFTKKLISKLEELDYQVVVIERPMWQLNLNIIRDILPDVAFVPHRDPGTFAEGKEFTNVYYYMQTVFPHLFSINTGGWGGFAKPTKRFIFDDTEAPNVFEEYRSAIDRNESKFPQPENNNPLPFDEYILFTCQIPHDQTIKLHSDVEVIDGLRAVLEFTKRWNMNLIVKGHPINPASMVDLKSLTEQYPHARWVLEEHSIHKLLTNCDSLFTINSGTGMEGILHKKPVFIFGKADYSSVVTTVEPNYNSIRSNWRKAEWNVSSYETFFNNYVHNHFNSRS